MFSDGSFLANRPLHWALAALGFCPALAVSAAALTPLSANWQAGEQWCLFHPATSETQLLSQGDCDRPQAGLIRHFR
jgi:hypothetical protein